MCKFSSDNKARVGNAILYIASKVHDANKTKILKLLYLFEEEMVKKYHIPFFGIPYFVWVYGPVQNDVFVDLSDGPILFGNYIAKAENGMFVPNASFDEDEFSDAELNIMESVIEEYGQKPASQLVAFLHKDGSLWYKAAKRYGLLESFNSREANNSSIEIDFSELLDEEGKEHYLDTLSMYQASNEMKISSYV